MNSSASESRYICFDVGGTAIKCGVLAESGEVLSFSEHPTPAEDAAQEILKLITSMVKSSPLGSFSGICLSTTGLVDYVEGKILQNSNPINGYEGTLLRKELQERTSIPTEVENDVNCAALGELWLGAARGFTNVVCITVGTGIGGAFILDGRLHRGSRFNAMEVGNIPYYPSNWENIASTRALVQDYAKLSRSSPSELNGRIVIARAQEGDKNALQALDDMCFYLAQGIAALLCTLAPDVFILGGGIAESMDFLRPMLERHLEKTADARFRDGVLIRAAELGNRAGLTGALRHFLDMKKIRKDIMKRYYEKIL